MIVDIESDPRHAGRVRRYHTWPTITTQSVGEHTWQVMRIMMTVDVGMCTAELMKYAVFHDAGEMAGDIPWPGKRNSLYLRSAMEEAEKKVRGNMVERWGIPVLPTLSKTERAFFKACENLEMWEFAMQERNMGNRYATVIETRMLMAVSEYFVDLPTDTINKIMAYVTMRTAQESETELVQPSDPRHPRHAMQASDPGHDCAEFVEREERRG